MEGVSLRLAKLLDSPGKCSARTMLNTSNQTAAMHTKTLQLLQFLVQGEDIQHRQVSRLHEGPSSSVASLRLLQSTARHRETHVCPLPAGLHAAPFYKCLLEKMLWQCSSEGADVYRASNRWDSGPSQQKGLSRRVNKNRGRCWAFNEMWNANINR